MLLMVLGMHLELILILFEEVQKSNMSKLGNDGKPIYNEHGKVMKILNYLNQI